MPSNVEWAAAAEHDLRRLDQQTRERVLQAVHRFLTSGHGDVRQLQGRDREWRLRVGGWRVLFTRRTGREDTTIVMLRVLPRGRAYKS